jgi:hypothetical protein
MAKCFSSKKKCCHDVPPKTQSQIIPNIMKITTRKLLHKNHSCQDMNS